MRILAISAILSATLGCGIDKEISSASVSEPQMVVDTKCASNKFIGTYKDNVNGTEFVFSEDCRAFDEHCGAILVFPVVPENSGYIDIKVVSSQKTNEDCPKPGKYRCEYLISYDMFLFNCGGGNRSIGGL